MTTEPEAPLAGPLLDFHPGVTYKVSTYAILRDGSTLGVGTWVTVWDYEPTGDRSEAPVIITQSALDKTGNPLHDSAPMRATVMQGYGFKVSEDLTYLFAGTDAPIHYVPRDPTLNSTEIMRDLYIEQVHLEETQEGGLTTAQVAKRLGIKPSTWRSLVTRGSAPQPSGYYDGRTPYWMPMAVDTWRAIHPTRK